MRTRTTLLAVMAFMALTTTGCELLVPIEELRDGGTTGIQNPWSLLPELVNVTWKLEWLKD